MRRALILSITLAVSTTACPHFVDLCDDGACDPTDGGTSDVAQDVVIDVGGCDQTKELKESPKCIDDALGIFVSPTGSDTNAGTKAAPVATVAKALAILGSHPRIYVCEGTYVGSVDVTKSVAIYGGLKCDWTPSTSRPVVSADKTSYAIQVTAANVSLVDLEVNAKPGAAAGESSIGVFANAAQNLKLVRTKVSAGAGVAGTSGATGSNYTSITQSNPSIAGNNASGINGGGAHACTLCTDNKNPVGGAGGAGGAAPGDGSGGSPLLGGGAKGTGDPDGVGIMTCTSGGPGASPSSAGASAPAPTSSGTLDATGWKATSGAGGTNGAPGQGGGGGGGGYDVSNLAGGGGGGGCGGCGGAAGTGGTGGGSSIALLSFNATVTLTSSELIAANAGDGGKGAAGQAGQLGGFSGSNSNPGCPGGTGGTGANGGAGSGGSGGLSVGILYKGTKPTTDTATDGKITFGTKGNKGIGGAAGTNDGIDGVAQAVLQAP